MNLIIILISWIPFWHSIYIAEGKSENGTLPSLLYRLLPDKGTLIDSPSTPCLIACSASTQQEIRFNEEVSIGKSSIFLRKFHSSNESQDEIPFDICEKPFKPSLLYNSKDDIYEIGYELYYKEGEVQLECEKYDDYRSININKEIINATKHSKNFSIVYKDGNNTKFNSTNGYQTLIFYWIPALSIKISGQKKEIDFDYDRKINDELEQLQTKCEDYQLEDDFMELIFSRENQEKCLKNLLVPHLVRQKNPQKSFAEFYGYLEKSQMIPLWYFRARSAKLASCTRMNFVPVWKTIADGQLKKVDLYLFAVQHEFNTRPYAIEYICFGTSGILKLPLQNHSLENHQEINLIANRNPSKVHHRLIIPIPKIIYRIISIYVEWKGDYKAAIVIHNDPTPVSEEDRICPKELQLTGWDKINNEDSTTGLTYVCLLTQQIYDKLAAHLGAIYDVNTPLRLDSFFNLKVRDFSGLMIHEDRREQIDKTYEKVLRYVT